MPALTQTDDNSYIQRRTKRDHSDEKDLWELLDAVCDPEIPVLSLWDLGVLSNIERIDDTIIVTITPTYSGCPALEAMKGAIISTLEKNNYKKVVVQTCLSPAWSSDSLSPNAHKQLLSYGIAPTLKNQTQPPCPQCNHENTTLISQFGSTACKALYQCDSCLEPFDYFKSL